MGVAWAADLRMRSRFHMHQSQEAILRPVSTRVHVVELVQVLRGDGVAGSRAVGSVTQGALVWCGDPNRAASVGRGSCLIGGEQPPMSASASKFGLVAESSQSEARRLAAETVARFSRRSSGSVSFSISTRTREIGTCTCSE